MLHVCCIFIESQHEKSYSNYYDDGQGLHLWKINTKRSNESEIVRVSDALPQVIWYWKFLKAQGYQVNNYIIYQYKHSTIQIWNNDWVSTSKRTRHIDICYFCITNQIKSKEVKVEYCPTYDITAGFFSFLYRAPSSPNSEIWSSTFKRKSKSLIPYLNVFILYSNK